MLYRTIFFVATLIISWSDSRATGNDRQDENKDPHVVFLISEDPDNYEAPRTIPVFAESLRREHNMVVTVLLGEGERAAFRFPNLEVISGADLIVVFARRIALPHDQLDLIRNYLKQGKPLVGIRTANHAFSVTDKVGDGHEAWPEFVSEILGCENRGYGPQEAGVDVAILPEAKNNPVLKGVEPSRWHSEGSIYHVAPLLDQNATVLVTGRLKEKVEPIAWTRYTADQSRVFYTSLGYPSDFDKPQFRNLLVNGMFWALDLERSAPLLTYDSAGNTSTPVNSPAAWAQSPYPASPVIKAIKFEWSSHLRVATGSDNWPVTWADDDHQYVVWGDGGGFGGTNGIGRSSIGVARIENNWHDFKPINVWGGYMGENKHSVIGKSYGIVCVDNVLYMWVGMFQTKVDQFNEVRLAASQDHGATWEFADWSFTREEGVMMPTICNYGKNYEGARDDFVYSYLIRFQSYEGPDDYPDKVDWLNCQKPGIIDLARVHKDQIMNRDAYTFFGGSRNGKPVWTKAINDRKPVFENRDGVGWCINVSYNAGLGRYLLTTEHTESHRGNIGIFDAPEPWGPWTTVCYEKKWGEGHIPPNTFFWNFSNKWTSANGQEFTLIFTGRKENDSFNIIRGKFTTE